MKNNTDRKTFPVSSYSVRFIAVAPNSPYLHAASIFITCGDTIDHYPQAFLYFHDGAINGVTNYDNKRNIFHHHYHISSFELVYDLLASSSQVLFYWEKFGKWQTAGLVAPQTTNDDPACERRDPIVDLPTMKAFVKSFKAISSQPAPGFELYRTDKPDVKELVGVVSFHNEHPCESSLQEDKQSKILDMSLHVSLRSPFERILYRWLQPSPGKPTYKVQVESKSVDISSNPIVKMSWTELVMTGLFSCKRGNTNEKSKRIKK